jgi:hypothetical protein
MHNDYVPNTSPLGSSLWPLLSKASISQLKLQAAVSQISISKYHPGTNFDEALQNAVDTHSQLTSWSSSVPSGWTFDTFTLLQDHSSDEA